MAVGRHFEIYKNRNNYRTVDPILAKFGMELQLDTAQTVEGSKITLFRIQDGRRRKTEIYKKIKNLETFRPICTKFGIASTLHPEQACGLRITKFIIQDGRRPPF